MQNGNRVRVREVGSGVMVRVMARAWVRVRFRVVFCSDIAQFLTILHIPHCADVNGYGGKTSGWELGSVIRVMVSVSVSIRVYIMISGVSRVGVIRVATQGVTPIFS